MEIPFEGIYQRNDILRACWIHFNPLRWVVFLRAILVVAVAIAYALYLVISDSRSILDHAGVFLPIVIILFVLVRPFILPYESVSKFLKDPDGQKPISGSLSESGIVWNTSLSSNEYKWELFDRLLAAEDFSLLYQRGSKWFILIPRNFFQTELDWRQYLSLVRSKVKA